MEKIIQITSGRGPAECTWVVAKVLKNILQEAENNGIKTSVLQHEAGQENGTVETATVLLEGNNVTQFVNSWIGTIQWIGQSQFRKFHKRKNWFIGIFEVEKSSDLIIEEKDIQYQAMRSSGAGGQHVNKVSSAIRATHIPSGISVVSMDSRSQHQNKKLATERLLAKFKEESVKQLKTDVKSQWTNQLDIQRGNPVRVFQGSDFITQKQEKITNKNVKDLKIHDNK